MDDFTISGAVLKNATEYAIFHTASYHKPLYSALAAGLVNTPVVFRSAKGLIVNEKLGSVVTVFDVTEDGAGPGGFDAKLMDELIAAAEGLAVVSHIESPDPYIWSVEVAVKTGGIVLLVETTTAQEQAWLDVVKRSRNPQKWILWSSAVQGVA